jgi:hypothetical protein
MLISAVKLVQMFCQMDDFCILFEEKFQSHLLPPDLAKSAHSVNKPALALSEMMCIEVLYHLSGYKCFEYFYRDEVMTGSLRGYFPKAPSYNRFIELKPRILVALICYLHLHALGSMMGLYYADSTTLKACRNQRIGIHKVFKGKAQRGKTSMGWCYGFKLFVVINGLGELANAFLTPANVGDHNGGVMKRMFKGLKGLAFADKGFINGKAAEELMEGGLRLITSIRGNMKNRLMEMKHKLLLKKRGIIESVNDILKTVCDIEHSRHRSPVNMLVNTYAALIAYSTLKRKPSIFK